MDILAALTMQLFATKHQRRFKDVDHYLNIEHYGCHRRQAASKTHRHSELCRICRNCGNGDRTDRIAWGTYTECAPPILPPNTCVPGFENESLVIMRRGRRRRKSAKHSEHEISQPDESSDDGDSGEDSCEEHDGEHGACDIRDIARRRPVRPRSAFDILTSALLTSSLFPTLSFSASSLYGSTTLPATRVLFSPSEASTVNADTEHTPARINASRMAPRTHLWISLWFLLTAPVIFWDASYCFMRPRSFEGGDLHWIWKPYEIYQKVDYVYGVEAFNRGDGFANAQSFLNVVETFLNLYYVYAQHIIATPSAPLVGFAAAVMTLSKTVLYWAQEYFCGGCAVGHNDLWTLFWFWMVPNGLWLIFPMLVIAQLARDISAGLASTSKLALAKKE